MNTKVLMIAAVIAFAGLARAEIRLNLPDPDIDLNIIQDASQDILSFVAPAPADEPMPVPSPGPSPSPSPSPTPGKRIPQACKDANITEDQKTQIKEAIYTNMRDEVQLKANLKLAFMDYGHTIMDKSSDISEAQTSANGISTAIAKLTDSHLALGNNILYNIVTPDQRAKTYACILALHQMRHHKGGGMKKSKHK